MCWLMLRGFVVGTGGHEVDGESGGGGGDVG